MFIPDLLESFEMWYRRRTEKVKWPGKWTNEQVFERIEDNRTLLNNIFCVFY